MKVGRRREKGSEIGRKAGNLVARMMGEGAFPLSAGSLADWRVNFIENLYLLRVLWKLLTPKWHMLPNGLVVQCLLMDLK